MQFSVIIPIYNAESTLRRCLDSIAAQALGRAELILVNDGSTDGTEDICIEYCSRYNNIKYIYQENGGVSSARNNGLNAASGEFISFVDSDDLVTENYFNVLEEDTESDLLVFGVNIEKNGEEGGRYLPKSLADADSIENYYLEFVRSRNGSPWNKRFRRKIIEDNHIMFPIDLRIGEDFVFCIRYLMCTSSAAATVRCAYVVDETNQQSISRRYSDDNCDQALRNYNYTFGAIQDSRLAPETKYALMQMLDYNYYRTSFACVKHLLKAEMKFNERMRAAREILGRFAANDRGIKPLNTVHRLSKIVVDKQLAFCACTVALLHKVMGIS